MSILDFFKSADINKGVKEFRADNNDSAGPDRGGSRPDP